LRQDARGHERYLHQQQLSVEIMGRGYAWLDTGTHDSLMEAGQFIATLEKRQGLPGSTPSASFGLSFACATNQINNLQQERQIV
jgi:glucose-1-phosphate thymidylyltransferase